MKKVLKILNGLIFIGMTIILILIVGATKNDNQNKDQNQVAEQSVVNDYEELYIGYSIINKYVSYLYANEYNLFVNLYNSQLSVTEEKFDNIRNYFEGISLSDIIITSQEKINEDTYRIKYHFELFEEATMIYVINEADYSFYIISDSNIGDE